MPIQVGWNFRKGQVLRTSIQLDVGGVLDHLSPQAELRLDEVPNSSGVEENPSCLVAGGAYQRFCSSSPASGSPHQGTAINARSHARVRCTGESNFRCCCRSSSGDLSTFAAIRRASSRVRLALGYRSRHALRRGGKGRGGPGE